MKCTNQIKGLHLLLWPLSAGHTEHSNVYWWLYGTFSTFVYDTNFVSLVLAVTLRSILLFFIFIFIFGPQSKWRIAIPTSQSTALPTCEEPSQCNIFMTITLFHIIHEFYINWNTPTSIWLISLIRCHWVRKQWNAQIFNIYAASRRDMRSMYCSSETLHSRTSSKQRQRQIQLTRSIRSDPCPSGGLASFVARPCPCLCVVRQVSIHLGWG